MKQVDPAQVDSKWQVKQRDRTICRSANNDFPNIGRIAERFIARCVPEEGKLEVRRQRRQVMCERRNNFADAAWARAEIAAIERDVGAPKGRAYWHRYSDFIHFGLAEFWRGLPQVRKACGGVSHTLTRPFANASGTAGMWQISGLFMGQMTFISDHSAASNLASLAAFIQGKVTRQKFVRVDRRLPSIDVLRAI